MGNTLYLPLKKEWYEMIESGVKTEEYREIKPHWIPRLLETPTGFGIPRYVTSIFVRSPGILNLRIEQGFVVFKEYTHVKFSYGYTKRTMIYEIDSFTFGKGKPEWGAPTEDVFIIKLGKRISDEASNL